MRILLATGIFPPQIGGPATYSKLLYDELGKHGIKVEVANFGDHIDKPKVIRHFSYFYELLQKAPDADLIYALDPVSVGLPALLASQVRGKKLVLRVAGDYAWEQGTQRFGVTDALGVFARGEKKYSLLVRVLKKVQKYVADGATKIIVPSDYLKSILCDWGVDEKKITVVYDGVDAVSPKALKSTIRKKWDLEGPVISFVGEMERVDEYAGYLSGVFEEFPEANLWVLDKSTGQTKDRTAITFTGKLQKKELYECIKASDVCICDTKNTGINRELLEVMAIGTPTIVIGGDSEKAVSKDGINCYRVSRNDPQKLAARVIELLSERAVAFTLAKNAKKTASEFTGEKMLEHIAKVLTSI